MAMSDADLKTWAGGQLHSMGFDIVGARIQVQDGVVTATVGVGNAGNKAKVRYTAAGWVALEHVTPGNITNTLHYMPFRTKSALETHIRNQGLG